MSGTKFRLSCSSCGATFFSPDRRARYCPKCAKKKGVGASAAPAPTAAGGGSPEGKPRRPLLPLVPKKEPKPKRVPKTSQLTPELTERITQLYQEKYAANRDTPRKEVVSKISDELWAGQKVVSKVLPMYHPPKMSVSPEVEAQIIEAYKGYVERGERPEGGRRKTIANAHGLSFAQVRDIVYEYSVSQYQSAPITEPTREQKFRLEKLFWAELDHPRHHWDELPDKLAEASGEFTAWQVARWRDMLLDDESRFANVPDVEPGAEIKILDAYKQYLTAPAPPEQGLHHTIAQVVGDITPKQVHKVLQIYRNQRRDKYPLK